jgi:hypothetical protein
MPRFTRSGNTPGAAEARAAEAAAHSAMTKAIREAYQAAKAAEKKPAGGSRKTRKGRKRGTRRR